jgi:hypothetical protein
LKIYLYSVGVEECLEGSESSCTLICDEEALFLGRRLTNGTANNNNNNNNHTHSHPLQDSPPPPPHQEKEEPFLTDRESLLARRRERLGTVRALFYQVYASAVGFGFRTGGAGSGGSRGSGSSNYTSDLNGSSTSSGLTSLIGNFASRVGIRNTHN